MKLSFRARLALAITLLVLAVAAVLWFYLPERFEEEAIALTSHKAETLAQLTAFTILPAIHFQDRAALEEALRGARSDKDVDYVVVTDPGGARLAAFRPERASPAALSRTTAGGAVAANGVCYDVMLPIAHEGRLIGRLYLGISLERMHRDLRKLRIAIGALFLLILAGAVAAAMFLSNVMTRPLRELTRGARAVAAGNLDSRVSEGTDDEFALLARSFNEMTARVAERDASLRQMSRRLLTVQEQERTRISREIHDELGQALTAMKIDLQNETLQSPELAPALRRAGGTIDEIIDIVRRIATELRPAVLDDLGVTAALEGQLRRVRETSGIETQLVVAEEPHLDPLTGATLYRIAQEALTNIVRHSGASEVSVELSVRDGAAILVVSDNGRGMSAEQAGSKRSLGLAGMRERAELIGGRVEITSADGGGTTVTATLPLLKENDARSLR